MSRPRLKTHCPVSGDCGQVYRGLDMDGEFAAAGSDAAKIAAWPGTGGLVHVPKKLLGFFDKDMLQLFDFELRPYRSNDSI